MSNSEIYGYWVGSDEVHEVDFENHRGVGLRILRTIHNLEVDDDYQEICVNLLRLGYVRVINHSYDDGYDVEYCPKVPHTKLQKDFIKDAAILDEVDEDRRRL